MKLKSLLFGSAAVLAAGTGAQAADLPTAEPVEYVRICDAFGTGFYYIPGTDTCLRVGGYVRAESHYVDGFESQDVLFHYGVSESDFNNYTTRTRGNMRLDARTQTDIGLVRAFVSFNMTIGSADVGSYSNSAALDAAYIQVSNDWGTYTAGYTGSFFDFFGSKGYGTRLLIDDPTGNVTTFGWTFAGGNGFSFTVAAQDSLSGGTGRRLQPTFTPEAYEGQEFPDGVANIRVDQGWGSAQIMGAVHAIHDLDGFENDAGGNSNTELGFAVGAGLSLGIPGGWTFSGQGTYADGALSFVTNDPGIGAKGGFIAGVPFAITVGGGVGDFLGPDADDTNEAWGVRAAVWGPLLSPNLEVWLGGSFTDIDAHSIAGIAGSGDLLDYQIAAIQAGAAYTLAPNLTVGPEFAWNQIDWDTLPIDNDVWGVMWRIERGF